MKPRNFAGRKLLRQVRAYRRLSTNGVMEQSHEAFVLHGVVPRRYTHPPRDIRLRMGKAARLEELARMLAER